QFDNNSDTMKAEFGKLRGGQLHGEIRIFGPESYPGAEDQIEILTSEINITEQLISTIYKVDFRFGHSFGSGEHLNITLAPTQAGGKGKQSMGLAVSGAKSLELVHVKKFHLHTQPKGRPPVEQVADDDPSKGGRPDPKAAAQKAGSALFMGGTD